MLWGTLVHLGTNMWRDIDNFKGAGKKTYEDAGSSSMRLDKKLWDEYMIKLSESGCNTIVMDVGDGIVYKSHPEIAIDGSWSREEITAELEKMHKMGFEVIPKLNFSTTHDVWLKEYSKMVSTDTYYKVCKDLIDEVCEIFKPRFVHIGMDEEVYENQKDYTYVVIRQNDLWWHDLYYLVECVEKNGARAMMWSDYARNNPEEFIEKCPKSVVQCVWYYFDKFGENLDPVCECRVRAFDNLDKAGFDIFAGGSIEYFDDNMKLLTQYCAKNLSKEHMFGFIQTTWEAVEEKWRDALWRGIDTLKDSKEWYESEVH